MLLAIPLTVSAHFLGHSSVDSSEIRWGGGTIYTDARDHAHTTWNALGAIDILPDTSYTYEDVTYNEVHRSDVTWSGQYTWYPSGTDTITFNGYYMFNYTTAQRRHVALHEMGHALGLDHTWSPNVMVSGKYSIETLGDHDKSDYNSLWGN